MSVDEAEVWLRQVVKGGLADPTTNEAIEVILRHLGRLEEPEDCEYLMERGNVGAFGPYLKNKYTCTLFKTNMPDKTPCEKCKYKIELEDK